MKSPNELKVVEGAGDETRERRSEPRLALEVEVSLASDSQFFTGLSGNLSTGGVFVATYQRLTVGRPVVMQIALPDGEVLAKGTVRWVREASDGAPPGFGIAFDTPLGPEDAERVARFVVLREPLLHDGE